jgi:hypothetical protein
LGALDVVVMAPQPPGADAAASAWGVFFRRSSNWLAWKCRVETEFAAAAGAQPGLSGWARQVCSVQVSQTNWPFEGQLAATKSCQAVCSLLAATVVGNVHADAAAAAAGVGSSFFSASAAFWPQDTQTNMAIDTQSTPVVLANFFMRSSPMLFGKRDSSLLFKR